MEGECHHMNMMIGLSSWIFICNCTFNNVSTEETVRLKLKSDTCDLRFVLSLSVDGLRFSVALISFGF